MGETLVLGDGVAVELGVDSPWVDGGTSEGRGREGDKGPPQPAKRRVRRRKIIVICFIGVSPPTFTPLANRESTVTVELREDHNCALADCILPDGVRFRQEGPTVTD